MKTLKAILEDEEAEREYFLAGNSTCAGCGLDLALRWAMKALGPKTVLVAPASCLNVVVGLWPKTAPDFPFINMAFAAGAAAATGLYHGLKARGYEDYNVMVFAGDGGTADIGIQALSGAAERGTNIIYVCYDNEAYQNTGNQRSSSTPYGTITTTTPYKKRQQKKYIPGIMNMHNIPYVATCSVSEPIDLYNKFLKAKSIKGLKYIQIFAPCPPGWRYDTADTIQEARMAVDTGLWPLYEIENGMFTLSGPSFKARDPSKRASIRDYLKGQGRFKKMDEDDVKEIEKYIDWLWNFVEKELMYKEAQKKK
jgi:pyruvate ferredoxin oxidoreductase beta subunit